jgi:hypothetical protein
MKQRLEVFEHGMNAEFWAVIAGIRRDVTPYITPWST